MFDYDYIDAVEKRYNNIFSLGGNTERSFWQNVGKIVNKDTERKNKSAFDEIIKNTEDILRGTYDGSRV